MNKTSPSEKPKDRLIPWEQAAERLGLMHPEHGHKAPRVAVQRMGRRGVLRVVNLNRHLMVSESSLDRLVSGKA